MLAYLRRFSIDKEISGKGKHKIRDNRHVRRRLIAGAEIVICLKEAKIVICLQKAGL